MTAETKRPFAHLTLIELLIGIVLLIGAGIFLVHSMRQAKHREQQRLIIQALNDADFDTVLKLAKANPNLWSANANNGDTPLHYAAALNAKDVAELLIARGADVNAKRDDGLTPLHLAADRNAKDVAELLIAKGVDVNAKTNDGVTPLYFAAYRNTKDVAELLIANGADVNAKSNNGETPLQRAIRLGNTAIADLLRAHGATK